MATETSYVGESSPESDNSNPPGVWLIEALVSTVGPIKLERLAREDQSRLQPIGTGGLPPSATQHAECGA